MANNRTAGHDYERLLAKRWRELGFQTTTSRYSSREEDDKGADLCGTGPFRIQAKRYRSAPSYHWLLKDMAARFTGEGVYPIIYHKRPGEGEVVVMSASDFEELVSLLKKFLVI